MFYQEKEVINILNCKNCQERLVEPKLLPCGKSICSLCLKLLIIKDKMFDCFVCKEKHEMPKKGLPKNQALEEMLAIKSNTVSRGKEYDTFRESLNHIKMNINLINIGVNNRDDFIKEHCIELRNEVQLVTEENIEQINDFNSEIIKRIDEYEKEQLKMNKDAKKVDLNSSDSSLKNLNDFLKEMQSFYDENIKCLNENQIKDLVIVNLSKNALNMQKKSEDKLKTLQRINLCGRLMKFNAKYIQKINLGTINIIDIRICSTILSGSDQVKDLITLCEFAIDQTWNLIYRASQDGFESVNFHLKCDNKQNTLVIIKSTNGNIFGGYTEQSWGGNDIDPYNLNSFIFSLINTLDKPIKIKWSKGKQISCDINLGPAFGSVDIHIGKKSNSNDYNYAELGSSYTHPDYAYNSIKAKSFLAGANSFQVSEIEVFTKQ
jgi:hypothetical protein